MEQRGESEQVKDAYSAWLKELYADPALRSGLGAKRILRKKKKKRKAPTVHALQPTQSSSLKHVATRKLDEQSRLPLLAAPTNPAAIQDAKSRRYRVLANAANYVENEYHAPYQPGLAFFHLLAEQILRVNGDSTGSAVLPNFSLEIPPTILRVCNGQSVQVMLLYSKDSDAAERVLCVRHFATDKQFQSQRASILHLLSSNGQLNEGSDIQALLKLADGADCRSNRVQLIKTEEELLQKIDTFWSCQDDNQTDSATYCAIQKFISCKGNSHSGHRNAWISRPVCRNKELTSIWIITSASSVHDTDITNSMDEASCQIVKCTTAQSWQEPRLLATTFKYMLEKLLQTTLMELVLDLLQDGDGRWWLLQVKAFQHRRTAPGSLSSTATPFMSRANSAPNRLETLAPAPEHGGKRWRCAGRYCSRSDNNHHDIQKTQPPELEPSGFLMKKIMLSCEFFDKCFISPLKDMSLMSGFPDFSAALGFHLQHQTSKRERNQFYESQPVCSACLAEYHSLREQWMASVTTKTSVTSSKHSSAPLRVKKETVNNLDPSIVPRLLPSLETYPTDKLASLMNDQTPSLPKQSLRRSRELNETASYLDEMKNVERMLSQVGLSSSSDAGSSQDQSQMPKPSPEHLLRSHEAEYDYSSLFQRRDVDRVEAMWQSLSFTTPSTTAHKPTKASPSKLHPRPQYNSFSLAHELSTLQQPIAPSPYPILSVVNEASEASEALPVHRMPIYECRKLFYDDLLREQLVSEASSMLLQHSTTVCFEIIPIPTDRADEDASLAELLLRSLFLDLSQAISSRSAAPWRRRMPSISRDVDGHTILTITPSSA